MNEQRSRKLKPGFESNRLFSLARPQRWNWLDNVTRASRAHFSRVKVQTATLDVDYLGCIVPLKQIRGSVLSENFRCKRARWECLRINRVERGRRERERLSRPFGSLCVRFNHQKNGCFPLVKTALHFTFDIMCRDAHFIIKCDVTVGPLCVVLKH